MQGGPAERYRQEEAASSDALCRLQGREKNWGRGLKERKEGAGQTDDRQGWGQNYDGQRVGGAVIGEGWGVFHEGWLSEHTGSHGPPP